MPVRCQLYPTIPRAPIEYETARTPTPTCTRCPLAKETKNVCARTDGAGLTGEPGGTLIVAGAPLKGEDYPGSRPVSGEGGRFLRARVEALGVSNVAWTWAVRCARPEGEVAAKDRLGEGAIKACRAYLSEDIRYVKPSRIIAVGDTAARALLGDDAPRTAGVSRAVGWLSPALLPGAQPIPVFLLTTPAEALRSRPYRAIYSEDFAWALTATPAQPPWKGSYSPIHGPEEARTAVAAMRASYAAYRALCDADPYAALTFDCETSGAMWTPEFKVLCIAVALSWQPDEGWLWDGKGMSPDALAPLLALLADPAMPIAGQNVKYDCNALKSAYGVEVRGVVFDTRLVSRLLDSDMDADLDSLGWTVGCGGHKAEAGQHLAAAVKTVKKASKLAAAIPTGQSALFAGATGGLAKGESAKSVAFGLIPPEVLGRYCARDTVATARLVQSLSRAMRTPFNSGPRRVWDGVVRDATEVFSRMESRGFPVDKAGVLRAADTVAARIDAARATLAALAPKLNPDSPDQVGAYLYGELGLKTDVKTEGGGFSTARDTLEKLAGQHPAIAPLLEYGELTHMRGLYLDGTPAPGARYGTEGILKHLRPHHDGTWRAHTTYNLTAARTGRLSSTDPNLQNIPRNETPLGKTIKDLFCAPPGRVWVQLDFSQLELRVAALVSSDPVMAQVFASGIDYHMGTAELIAPVAFGLSPAKWAALSAKERKPFRSTAKVINFALLYGQGVKTLAKQIGCDLPTAEKTVNAILGQFKKLKEWLEARKREAQTTGYVHTRWGGLPGRRRPLYHMEFTDTVSVNTPIQGEASDYCLASVCAIERWIEGNDLAPHVELVGTVHDSIMLLAEEDYAEEAGNGAAAIMEGWVDGPVKLLVDGDTGQRWGSLGEFKITR